MNDDEQSGVSGDSEDTVSEVAVSSTAREALRNALQSRPAEVSNESQEQLARDHQEELRKLSARIRRFTTAAPGWNFMKAAMPKVPQTGVAPEVMKMITGTNGINSPAINSFISAAQEQASWSKNSGVINSDLSKILDASQLQGPRIIEHLAQSIDLGITVPYARLSEQISAQQASWFKSIIPDFGKFHEAFWPKNLRGIEGLYLEDVESVTMLDGIGLYRIPRQSIAEALISADSAGKRREILGRRWRAISSDCREALESCESETLAKYVTPSLAALDALDAGHTHAAQALVGSVTDAILAEYLGTNRYLYTPNRKTRTSDAYKKFGIRKFIALAPMWQAYQQFRSGNGDPIPSTFNRHATAHTVSKRQFNRRNAVQGLLFLCGLISFREESIRIR